MDADLRSALIAAAVTGVLNLGVWVYRAAADVREHDVDIRAIDDEVGNWVRENRKRLDSELNDARNEANRRGVAQSGVAVAMEKRLRKESTDREHDEAQRSRAAVARITAREGRHHKLWRRGGFPLTPNLDALEKAANAPA